MKLRGKVLMEFRREATETVLRRRYAYLGVDEVEKIIAESSQIPISACVEALDKSVTREDAIERLRYMTSPRG